MTPEELNLLRVQRILDNGANLRALRANIADGSHTIEAVLHEVLDANQREQLRKALTES